MTRALEVARLDALFALVVSEVLFHALGGRFDDTHIVGWWQFLDLTALKERLFESLWYLHAQPPGLNFVLGVALKLGPRWSPLLLELVLLACSFQLLRLLSHGLEMMGASRIPRVAGVFLLALSPPFVLFGHAYFYTQFEATFLLGAVVSTWQLVNRRSVSAMWRFGAYLTALALFRSAYHLAFVGVSVAIVGWYAWRAGAPAKRLVAPLALALILPGAWYAKNKVEFRVFTSSSWLGMNLSKNLFYLGGAKLAWLNEQGIVSEWALKIPFPPPDQANLTTKVPRRFADISVVAEPYKTSGDPNYNHFGYIAISRRLQKDALKFIRFDPRGYYDLISPGFAMYVETNGEALNFELNAETLRPWRDLYEPIVYLRRARSPQVPGLSPLWYPVLFYGIPLLSLALVGWLLSKRLSFAERAALSLALWCFVYTCLLNLLERGENNRFRYAVDPLYLWLAVAMATRLWRLARRWSHSHSIGSRSPGAVAHRGGGKGV